MEREKSARSFRSDFVSRVFFLLVCLPLTWYYFKNRKPPTEHEIRRDNLILANENINSSPSVIQKRYDDYEKERIQKQFRIVVVEKKLNRHGNAFLSESDLKDPKKRGKTMSTIEKPNLNEIEQIAGVRKYNPQGVVEPRSDSYI